jgi:transcriptional regulator with XRE-family HTH domain
MAEVKQTRGITLPHLEAWRLYRALTQAELAKLSGVSRTTIGTAELHGTGVRASNVRKLAKALEISPSVLIGQAPTQTRADEAAQAPATGEGALAHAG